MSSGIQHLDPLTRVKYFRTWPQGSTWKMRVTIHASEWCNYLDGACMLQLSLSRMWWRCWRDCSRIADVNFPRSVPWCAGQPAHTGAWIDKLLEDDLVCMSWRGVGSTEVLSRSDPNHNNVCNMYLWIQWERCCSLACTPEAKKESVFVSRMQRSDTDVHIDVLLALFCAYMLVI